MLFADYMSIIIYYPDSDSFQNPINDVFVNIKKWFKMNKLTLNFDKTDFIKSTTNNKTSINFNTGYNKTIEEAVTTKFLCFEIDDNRLEMAH
jgi:hypothetical protein